MTVEPTEPVVGERVMVGFTVKVAEAVPALVAPTPSTVCTPAVAVGTAKVVVPLPSVETVTLATLVVALAVSYHFTATVSPAA